MSICVSPCVCPNAISSHIYGQIWTLKVPMDFLGQGGGNKTICKVMGPKMKKKNYWRHLFWFYYLPSISCPFVFLSCTKAIYFPSFGQIWTLKVPRDSLGPGGDNKTICKVMGPEMKKKILGTPFLILLPT